MKYLLILPILTLCLSLQAQQPVAPADPVPQDLTLAECIAAGVERNFDIKIARNNATIALNNHSYAPFMPTLEATARESLTADHQREGSPGANTATSNPVTNTLGAAVSMGWTLFDGMGMFAEWKRTRELTTVGDLELKSSIEDMVAGICEQYYYIVTQSNRLEAAKLYLEISTLRYNQALEKYMIGSISGLEMKQAKLDLNADSSRLVLQRELLRNAYVEMLTMTNMPLDTRINLTDTIVPVESLQLPDLKAMAMDRNTSILLAQSGVKLSELDITTAVAGRYPTVKLNADYHLNRYDYHGPSRWTQLNGPVVGLTVTGRLFAGGETNRKIKNARLSAANSGLAYDRTVLQVTSQLTTLFNTYRKNVTMIGFETESAETALLNLQAAMDMYRLGTMSGVEFREIQRSYIDAADRRFDASYQAKVSEINLLYLAGAILNEPQ